MDIEIKIHIEHINVKGIIKIEIIKTDLNRKLKDYLKYERNV